VYEFTSPPFGPFISSPLFTHREILDEEYKLRSSSPYNFSSARYFLALLRILFTLSIIPLTQKTHITHSCKIRLSQARKALKHAGVASSMPVICTFGCLIMPYRLANGG
jgi:hypothetical protein